MIIIDNGKLLRMTLVASLVTVYLFFPTNTALAQWICSCTDGTVQEVNDPAICNAAGCTVRAGSLDRSGGSPGGSGGPVVIDNPLGENDPRVIIGNVIRVVLGIVGSLALIIFIYGGLTWMTSSGNTERIKRGRDTLVWAAIGLMVIFGSYTVVNFVIQSLARPPTG